MPHRSLIAVTRILDTLLGADVEEEEEDDQAQIILSVYNKSLLGQELIGE